MISPGTTIVLLALGLVAVGLLGTVASARKVFAARERLAGAGNFLGTSNLGLARAWYAAGLVLCTAWWVGLLWFGAALLQK